MKIVFYAADKPREHMLALALEQGAKKHGDTLEMRRTADYGETDDGDDRKYPGPSPDTDVACTFGVKGRSLQVIRDHRQMKLPTLYFDKGYTRDKGECGHTLHSRISINSSEPTAYMMREAMPLDRWKKLGLKLHRRDVNANGGHVLLCGSSAKYHEFHKLTEPNEWADSLVRLMRRYTTRQIIYRPKPSWKDAKPVPDASFSHGMSTIAEALRGCWCVVTHGSAAAFDAVLAGVPAFVLGKGIASPVARDNIERLDDPFWPRDEDRQKWANAMAYCQWTADELRDGSAWEHLKSEIKRQCV